MKWITDPAKLAAALERLTAMSVNANGEANAQRTARAVLREYQAAEGTVPVLEKFGRTDMDLDALLADFDTVFHALATLRNGDLVLDSGRDPRTLNLIAGYLDTLVHRLEPRLAGLTAACIRAHHAAGGSHGELATAMDAPRATAQKRSSRVRATDPGRWEKWATGELDISEHPACDLRPGWTFEDQNGNRHQVQEVRVYADGLVEIETGATAPSFCFDPNEQAPAIPHPAPNVLTSTGTITTPDGKDIGVTTYTRTGRAHRTDAAS